MFHRAFLILLLLLQPLNAAQAQPVIGAARLDQLFSALGLAKANEWQVIENEILALWQQSGSPSMDLLLERGHAALSEQDYAAAIEHLTALTDHAPDFAEGWNARATAFFLADMYGPALADIRRTLRLEPRHFGALAGLGLILEETGQHSLALAAFHEVARLHPNSENIAEAIARLERALGITEG